MHPSILIALLALTAGCGPAPETDGSASAAALATLGSVRAAEGQAGPEAGRSPTALAERARADTAAVVTRRLLSDPLVDWLVSPSPDGRRIAHTDWITGDLAVRDLETGEATRLTEQPDPYAEGFALFPSYSPDGRWVAYGWWNAERPWEWELRVVGAEGGEPRVLVEGVPYIQAGGWSPDGRTLAAVLNLEDGTNQLLLVDAEKGTRRLLKAFDWRAPGFAGPVFSPDGRWIAYDFPPEEEEPERDVYVLAVDGGQERAAVHHPADDRLLGWAPTGHLLFQSDRGGTTGAWLLATEDGRPRGAPELVKPELWRASPVGFTESGAFVYGVQTGSQEVHTVGMDPETGRVTGTPSPVAFTTVGRTTGPAWSPDGRYLAYRIRRTPEQVDNGHLVAVQSLETGEVRELPLQRDIGYLYEIRWSRTGGDLVVRARDRRSRQGLYRLDPITGRMELLFQMRDPDVSLGPFDLHPDGRRAAYRSQVRLEDGMGIERLVLRDLEEGSERVLTELPPGDGSWLQLRGPTFSPDGERLAYLEWIQYGENRVMLMPLEGGEPRELFRGSVGPRLGGWTPDGHHLFVTEFRETEDAEVPDKVLLRLDAETGEAEPLGLTLQGLMDPVVHPDGRRIAFTAGSNTFELWAMEGFLPGSPGASVAGGAGGR